MVVLPAFGAVWASGGGVPPWRPRMQAPLTPPPMTRFDRFFAWAFATSFFLAGTYFCLVKLLGHLVGGTTNSGLAGMGPDGTYHLYASWRPDKQQPVSAGHLDGASLPR